MSAFPATPNVFRRRLIIRIKRSITYELQMDAPHALQKTNLRLSIISLDPSCRWTRIYYYRGCVPNEKQLEHRPYDRRTIINRYKQPNKKNDRVIPFRKFGESQLTSTRLEHTLLFITYS